MIFSLDEWPGGVNLAYSPAIWRELFEMIPGDSFGLNLDPSHLVWQMIDYERAVYDFGDRIFHVHAKDLEIHRDGLYDHGVMSVGMGWQVPRLPGLGEVRWDRFFAALYAVGYDRRGRVEHEDRSSRAATSPSSVAFTSRATWCAPRDRGRSVRGRGEHALRTRRRAGAGRQRG